MLKKIIGFIIIFCFFFSNPVSAYIFTKKAPLIEQDEFQVSIGMAEYFTTDVGSVFEVPFIMHLGLARRVEFMAKFPYYMIENIRTNPISTFGDILLFLKFDIRQFDFYYPCLKKTRVDNYMDLVREVIADEEYPEPVSIPETYYKRANNGKRKFTVYAPGAQCVKLVGAFNDWSQDEDSILECDEYGVWYKEMDLAPGVYQYKFLIDDIWEEDQYNPYFVKDAFGGKNSVIEVEEEG